MHQARKKWMFKGVPEAVLEECDLCHDLVPMMEVIWTGTQTLCRKCEGIKASSPVI